MKKKILALCLVVVLAVTAVTGATLAYFTDTDAAVNVMTVGNVSIEQNEQERAADGTLVPFKDNKKLMPVTGDTYAGYDDEMTVGDYTYKCFSNDINVLDKIVTVTNDGSEEAYVRTIFAFEMLQDDEGNWIDPVNTTLNTVVNQGLTPGKGIIWPRDNENHYVIIDVMGVKYIVGEYYYRNESKLASGETSHPSLQQIYLQKDVGNEWSDMVVGGSYEILVLSQGVQTEGFADAATALNTAFGTTVEKAAEWFNQNWVGARN